MDNLYFAFALTLFAGLSTGIGSLIAFFTKKVNAKFLSLSLGFSAGVMIYISFVEMIPASEDALLPVWGHYAKWLTMGAFFFGILFTAIIDMIVPNPENPHEIHKDKGELDTLKDNYQTKNPKKMLRLGLFSAGVLALHNFPEGLATFMSAMQSPTIAVSIAIAIAIHNIPEGIAVSVPIFYATGSRKKALIYSFLSGLSEPLGAVIGYLVLRPFLNDTLFGIVFSTVAGIMVYISFDELLPAAREYGEHHISIMGLFSGMLIMAISLALF